MVRVLEAAGAATGVEFEWHPFAAGAEAFERFGEYIPQALTVRDALHPFNVLLCASWWEYMKMEG